MLDVVLIPSDNQLNEVVVTYGIKKEQRIRISVSTVTSKDLL